MQISISLKKKKFDLLKLLSTYAHPFKHLLKFSAFILKNNNLKIIPFALIITFHRYVGLIKQIVVY